MLHITISYVHVECRAIILNFNLFICTIDAIKFTVLFNIIIINATLPHYCHYIALFCSAVHLCPTLPLASQPFF